MVDVIYDGLHFVSVSGQAECSLSSDFSSTTVLIPPAGRFENSSEPQWSELRCDDDYLLSCTAWCQARLISWSGRLLLQHIEQIMIQSDASQLGWGVRSVVPAGARNAHQFLGVTLVIQTFLKDCQCFWNWTTKRLWYYT